jgi:hypothetical protein
MLVIYDSARGTDAVVSTSEPSRVQSAKHQRPWIGIETQRDRRGERNRRSGTHVK